jgi:hypothetical protein
MTVIINGTDNSASTPAVTGTDGDTGMFYPAANTVALSTGGSERMRVDSSGNVGIGTTSPSTYGKFAVSGLAFGSSYYVTSSSGGVAGGARFGAYFGSVNVGYVDHAVTDGTGGAESADIRFGTINSGTLAERARITSGGKVLIGTTTVNQSAPLEILKTGNTPTIFLAQSDTGGYNIQSRAIDNGGTFFHASFNEGASGGGTQRGSITSNGSATAYNTGSDYRLKENIAPMVGALNVIAQLKPSTFTWKSTGKQSQGFIAHELAEVLPDCVTGEKDAVETYTDEEGVEQTRPIYQGIDTSFLVATLTAAIQELKAINDAQAQRIETLEAKVAALEGAE